MCFKPKVPDIKPVEPAPDRASAANAASAARQKAGEQTSTYGNIFTSVLGDSSYGKNVKPQNATAALGA